MTWGETFGLACRSGEQRLGRSRPGVHRLPHAAQQELGGGDPAHLPDGAVDAELRHRRAGAVPRAGRQVEGEREPLHLTSGCVQLNRPFRGIHLLNLLFMAVNSARVKEFATHRNSLKKKLSK